MLVPLATTLSEGEPKRRALKLWSWSISGHKSASPHCLSQSDSPLASVEQADPIHYCHLQI